MNCEKKNEDAPLSLQPLTYKVWPIFITFLKFPHIIYGPFDNNQWCFGKRFYWVNKIREVMHTNLHKISIQSSPQSSSIGHFNQQQKSYLKHRSHWLGLRPFVLVWCCNKTPLLHTLLITTDNMHIRTDLFLIRLGTLYQTSTGEKKSLTQLATSRRNKIRPIRSVTGPNIIGNH